MPWVEVPEIPVGTSGKTDRRRLAATAPPRPAAAGVGAPHDLLAQRLCALVADVVGAGVVGAEDDFFALGGDSLRVLRLIADAETQLGLALSLADVFAHPTPAGLAALAGTGPADASRVVRTSRHGVLDGDLDVVVATAPRPERWLDADGWRGFVSGAVTVHPVDATHGDLVRRPAADRVGAILAGLLR